MNAVVALERLGEVILDPMNRDGMINAKGELKTVRAAMMHGPSAVTLAALCLRGFEVPRHVEALRRRPGGDQGHERW